MRLPRFLSSLAATVFVSACAGQSNGPATTTGPSGGASPASPTASPANKPNIIFIVADDLDSESIVHMPILQAHLVALGATFDNAFASTPICCPSRASMLTGQFAHNHGIWSNGRSISCFESFRDAGREASTVATWLKAAGYRTGLVGKYLNRYPGLLPTADDSYVPEGWDDWVSVFAKDRTSDAYYEYSLNENRQIVEYGRREQDYLTDVLIEKSLEFIRKSPAGRPFFLWLAPNAPHNPAEAAPRHRGAHANKFAPKGPAFNEEDMSDKPRWYRENHPRLTAAQIRDIDGSYKSRLETMMAVDEGIAKLVETLASLDLLANTYIVFTSDNGFLLGQHRFPHGKAAPYEESIRIPLIIRGPGVPPGVRLRHDALNIDFAPTFAEIAQATLPGFVDGRSLKGLLSSAPTPLESWRKDILAEHEASHGDGLPSWQALRTSEWIFIDYPADAEQEYYDLIEDPYQINSRHGGLDSARKQQLKTRLDQLITCAGAACRN